MNIFSIYNNHFLKANKTYLNELAEVNGSKNKAEINLEAPSKTSFKDYINMEMEKLNNQQIKSDSLMVDFMKGDVEDIHSVIIAADEARLSLELAVQIRNRCIEAYKEINNMQL